MTDMIGHPKLHSSLVTFLRLLPEDSLNKNFGMLEECCGFTGIQNIVNLFVKMFSFYQKLKDLFCMIFPQSLK